VTFGVAKEPKLWKPKELRLRKLLLSASFMTCHESAAISMQLQVVSKPDLRGHLQMPAALAIRLAMSLLP
jgi:hypothetical protein